MWRHLQPLWFGPYIDIWKKSMPEKKLIDEESPPWQLQTGRIWRWEAWGRPRWWGLGARSGSRGWSPNYFSGVVLGFGGSEIKAKVAAFGPSGVNSSQGPQPTCSWKQVRRGTHLKVNSRFERWDLLIYADLITWILHLKHLQPVKSHEAGSSANQNQAGYFDVIFLWI